MPLLTSTGSVYLQYTDTHVNKTPIHKISIIFTKIKKWSTNEIKIHVIRVYNGKSAGFVPYLKCVIRLFELLENHITIGFEIRKLKYCKNQR